MGLVLRVLTRLLFVALFVGSGVNKLREPQASAVYLSSSYTHFHGWVSNLEATTKLVQFLPADAKPYLALAKEYVAPAFLQDNSVQLVTYVGVFQILSSVLLLLGFAVAGELLYLFTLATIVVFHNPFAATNQADFLKELPQALLNLAIAGIALFIATATNSNASTTDSANNQPSAKPIKTAPQNQNSGSKISRK